MTDKNQAIETFGLTALEAMSAGVPVIVPTVGGIAEMVDDGENGWKIDVANLGRIAEKISEMLNDKELYCRMAKSALEYSKKFSENSMLIKIKNIIGG